MKKVIVNTPDKSYDVLIGKGLVKNAGEIIKSITGISKLAVVTDDKVNALHAEKLLDILKKDGFETEKFVFPNGEQSKNISTYSDILNFLAKNHFSRTDMIVALGGGVTGDMAGFAAATYQRGIKLVQMPTTLLACVDSSVGGKTAIDLEYGKNLAGAFYQPCCVICDTELLRTLDGDVYKDGCAEVIKYAAIFDEKLFSELENCGGNISDGAVYRCVTLKKEVVAADEKDTGERQLLNFGHTFGHAVEKCSNYTLSHGKAVAAGMAVMARACIKKGLCGQKDAERLISLIRKFGLPTETEYSEKELFDAVMSDKKRRGGSITLVVFKETGRCGLFETDMNTAREFLAAGLE